VECQHEYSVNNSQNTTEFYLLLLVYKFSNYNYMFRPFLVAIIRLYIPDFKSFMYKYAN